MVRLLHFALFRDILAGEICLGPWVAPARLGGEAERWLLAGHSRLQKAIAQQKGEHLSPDAHARQRSRELRGIYDRCFCSGHDGIEVIERYTLVKQRGMGWVKSPPDKLAC